MEKAINIIIAVVVIGVFSFIAYTFHQESLRSKELDKKRSDNLDDQKEINKLLKEKIASGEINIISVDTCTLSSLKAPSANGKKKKTVKLSKEKSN